MNGEFRIVRGNDYPLKVYLDHMDYNDKGRLQETAINLNTISNLHVYAFKGDYYMELEATTASDGTYLQIVIPSKNKKRCLCLGNWGISLTGSLDGYQIAATEHNVFSIVPCNARSYIPPTIVDGEGSYMYNLRFGSLDAKEDEGGGGGDDPGVDDAYEGWIGFSDFENPSGIDIDNLTKLNDIRGLRSWTNNHYGYRFVIVTKYSVGLTFEVGGLPASFYEGTYNNMKCYYSDTLQEGTISVKISSGQ